MKFTNCVSFTALDENNWIFPQFVHYERRTCFETVHLTSESTRFWEDYDSHMDTLTEGIIYNPFHLLIVN